MAQTIIARDAIGPDEQLWYTMDFGPLLNPGATITGLSMSAACVNNTAGMDATPSARLLTGTFGTVASPSIVPSKTTGKMAQAISQMVGTCVSGCMYLIKFIATTSDGEELAGILQLTCYAD